MKKYVLFPLAVCLLTLSLPSQAMYICRTNTFFIVNAVNTSKTPVNVTFSGGNWPVGDGQVASNSVRGYTFTTTGHNDCYYDDALPANKVVTTAGSFRVTTADGRPVCTGAWQHNEWFSYPGRGGQHDRFYLSSDSKNCSVSPKNNPSSSNSGLHHKKKNSNKDDTYTLTVHPFE